MKLLQSAKIRNYIFCALLSIAVVCLIVAAQVGQQQDVVFYNDYNLYQQASTLIDQGNYAQAGQFYNILLQRHPHSYIMMWQYAYCLSQQGQYEQAAQYYVKARVEKPFIVENQQYLATAGQNFYNLGQYKQAYAYLSRVSAMGTDTSLNNAAAALLKQMDKLGRK